MTEDLKFNLKLQHLNGVYTVIAGVAGDIYEQEYNRLFITRDFREANRMFCNAQANISSDYFKVIDKVRAPNGDCMVVYQSLGYFKYDPEDKG
jgi:hypothetical protein